jgi:hypothetical protein
MCVFIVAIHLNLVFKPTLAMSLAVELRERIAANQGSKARLSRLNAHSPRKIRRQERPVRTGAASSFLRRRCPVHELGTQEPLQVEGKTNLQSPGWMAYPNKERSRVVIS